MSEPCPNQCRNGHIRANGVWRRCSCLAERLYKKELGLFMTNTPNRSSPLAPLVETSLLLEGPMSTIRSHVAGVILGLKQEGKTFTAMDAYRLVEIFLDKDEEFKSTSDIAQYDLYVMLLGFGDIKNQRLPDIIVQALQRRTLLQKPTWVILGMPLGQVPMKYDQAVFDAINSFKKVVIR